MNYGAVYQRLMERARVRDSVVGYSENHHVVPRCLGGGDSKENLVRLTAREHFVAHLLLVKMNPGHVGLVFAVVAMTRGNSFQARTSRSFAWIRQLAQEANRGRTHTAETRLKMSEIRSSNPPSRDHLSRIGVLGGKALKGRPSSFEGKTQSAEARSKISRASRGKPKSESHRAAMSAAMKKWHAERRANSN